MRSLLIYLACFILTTHFFYSQSIPAALFMLATLPVIVATWLHLQNGTLPLNVRLRMAAVLLFQALPLMLVLFILFPRVQGPLWGLPQDAYASSGLDDKMSPGSLSRLSLSDAVAFRVTFTGKPPMREPMYWRGPVLWDFDGRTWTPGKPLHSGPPKLDNLSNPIDYAVTLEPPSRPLWAHWLIFAAVALASMVLFRQRVYRALRQGVPGLKADFIGDELRVAQALAPGESCRMEVGGSTWEVSNVGAVHIPVGGRVTVVAVQGLTLRVEGVRE